MCFLLSRKNEQCFYASIHGVFPHPPFVCELRASSGRSRILEKFRLQSQSDQAIFLRTQTNGGSWGGEIPHLLYHVPQLLRKTLHRKVWHGPSLWTANLSSEAWRGTHAARPFEIFFKKSKRCTAPVRRSNNCPLGQLKARFSGSVRRKNYILMTDSTSPKV